MILVNRSRNKWSGFQCILPTGEAIAVSRIKIMSTAATNEYAVFFSFSLNAMRTETITGKKNIKDNEFMPVSKLIEAIMTIIWAALNSLEK